MGCHRSDEVVRALVADDAEARLVPWWWRARGRDVLLHEDRVDRVDEDAGGVLVWFLDRVVAEVEPCERLVALRGEGARPITARARKGLAAPVRPTLLPGPASGRRRRQSG